MRKKSFGVGLWIGVLLSAVSLGAAGGDARLADAVMRADRDTVRSLLQQKTDEDWRRRIAVSCTSMK